MSSLIGKRREELEKQHNFDYYLETKHDFLLGKKVDSKKLISSFVQFNKDRELKVVRLYDGVIQEMKDMHLSEIKNNLGLLADKKGIFYDDSDDWLATTYGFLCEVYFAEIMGNIIFFSGKKDCVINFARVLDENSIDYHQPRKVSEIGSNIKFQERKPRKIGRNEPCHCGSGKKYKECCLEKDIKETGGPARVSDLWSEDSFTETLDPHETKEKLKTFHKKHDENMNHNCRKCNARISSHNKDWHTGLCDECFDEHHQGKSRMKETNEKPINPLQRRLKKLMDEERKKPRKKIGFEKRKEKPLQYYSGWSPK